MDAKKLRESPTPPVGHGNAATALWHAARGEMAKAHDLVKDDTSAAAAWVHAHLHRREGDNENAEYWYGRAGKKASIEDFDDEWSTIAAGILFRQ